MLRKDKLLGGVLGLAVGDALGVPVEFVQREVLKSSPVESICLLYTSDAADE